MQSDQTSDRSEDAPNSASDPNATPSQVEEHLEAVDEALNEDWKSSEGSDLEQRLAEAEASALRARAELENVRKRMQRDADQQLKYANVPLVRDLLEVIDNLRRANEAASLEVGSADALRDGVEMVTQQFEGVLAKYGCKPIAALGEEFDPNYHEAIAQMPSDDFAAGLVAQEVAVGYRLHDRVIRPSHVIVSTGPTQAASS